ncbi:MAG: acyl-CoA dehydratase activase [Thermodesulfobacteriota bacterium]
MTRFLGIDCGSVSLNLALMGEAKEPLGTVYMRTQGRPLHTLVRALDQLSSEDVRLASVMVTGSARELIANALGIAAVNEISAHATGAHHVDPTVRTIIEIGGQDSKFIAVEPAGQGRMVRIPVFRMNEICAAGTGAFLDEQAGRLGIDVESFGTIALQSRRPAAIAGRCAVFAKTDMIHKAQEGTPLPDILLGLSYALVRNYIATLIRGDDLTPMVSLQGGVMANQAVLRAFRDLLGLPETHVTVPEHFKVLGAIGCAILAGKNPSREALLLSELRARAIEAISTVGSRSTLKPLIRSLATAPTPCRLEACPEGYPSSPSGNGGALERPGAVAEDTVDPRPSVGSGGPGSRPVVMGLDVGSVSAKGVLVDARGHVIAQDYRLSHSRPLDAVEQVMESLTAHLEHPPDAIAVTGSGRYLVGRLLDADLIVNEITAQAVTALRLEPGTDTVIDIGGQDSKWISLLDGRLSDFQMNRVCAAGTGSFLMEQAQRLEIPMGEEFSDAAFQSAAPADLGNRCTVFMESDLIHHQNNGASSEDLAAGVCLSIVDNYLERVANHRALGQKVLFVGGVAANTAVRAAFHQKTGRELVTPESFKVSGALGAALKLLEKAGSDEARPAPRMKARSKAIDGSSLKDVRKEQFSCRGCSNRCLIDKYFADGRIVFLGGTCDRWEREDSGDRETREEDPFEIRAALLEKVTQPEEGLERTWGMIRTPQFYEWFPFWRTFCGELGIGLRVSSRPHRKQFERGIPLLRVETCLPVKALAGQIRELVDSGVSTLFHPSILTEQGDTNKRGVLEYCPYIKASSQFFRGTVDVQWKEPVISYAVDPESFFREHVRFARIEGYPLDRIQAAYVKGMESLSQFRADVRAHGQRFLDSLGPNEKAFVVLGKPYHLTEPFLNLNISGLFRRLGTRAIPSDLLAVDNGPTDLPVTWKHQGNMIAAAQQLAQDPRIFPVLMTFFGCGPDPFTLRHVRNALGDKPLLVLEMDEHCSQAGVLTRLEAFLEQVDRPAGSPREVSRPDRAGPTPAKPEVVYVHYMPDHGYAFAAAGRSLGIDVRLLPPPDQESLRLGLSHMVGGECFPFTLLLGDFLKFANSLTPEAAERTMVYMVGVDTCRVSQYPVYMERVRREVGSSVEVIGDGDELLSRFGISPRYSILAELRLWEGLNAYDLILRLYHQLRPVVRDRRELERAYAQCKVRLFDALSEGRVRQGVEEALHDLYSVPLDQGDPRPIVAVTGDYYTRVVPFANNDVYQEVEELGGVIWSPPVFSDCFKMANMRDFVWSVRAGSVKKALGHGLVQGLLSLTEFRVKGGEAAKRVKGCPPDLSGMRMWNLAAMHTDTRLPSGITGPVATALDCVDSGADGVLNLMSLNCSFGTVVTAALNRALKQRGDIPMLTLVYDGLKKTNEKTRIEAFMDQVRDHAARKAGGHA